METKLNLITRRAKEERKCKFNNLMHLVNVGSLRECFGMLKRGKAAGIDRVRLEEYEKDLIENLEDLIVRMKRMSYRPQPVRRVYIPKGNGKTRPLGIPTVEDKLVQMAFARILGAIWEADFKDFSYGFRKGRNCHQALARVDRAIMRRSVNYVIDADIEGFFENVNHEWMKRCIEERISDKRFIRYIIRMLKSGIMEEGRYKRTEEGTPQGGVISPILANIYLHYILDVWFHMWIRKHCKGYAELVRYCDDFVICVEKQEEALRLLEELRERLRKFGLELSVEKTRIVNFGRHAHEDAKREGKKPGTFNFLGFTHYCGKGRGGNFKVGRRTENKRQNRSLQKVKNWLKQQRNRLSLEELWQGINLMLIGHYRYYGVSDNIRQISTYYHNVTRLSFKWLNRRSQKRSFKWESFAKYLDCHPLSKPRIYHNLYSFVNRSERQ